MSETSADKNLNYWLLTVVALAVTIPLFGLAVDLTRDKKVTPLATLAAGSAPRSAAPTKKWTPSEVEKDGITVAIENVEVTGGKTTVTLAMNNHRYDLGAMRPAERSRLAGQPASEYRVISAASGGHHVKAALAFPNAGPGELLIGLDAGHEFVFTLL